MQFHFHANLSHPQQEWSRTQTRPETEAQGNPEMAYYLLQLLSNIDKGSHTLGPCSKCAEPLT